MATASQIISRALRLLGVQDPRQALDAEEAQNALDTLNLVGQRWLASGLLAAWTDATSLGATVTPGASQAEALAYALALRVAPEYKVDPSQTILQQYDQELQGLWRDRLVAASGNTAENIILRALRLLAGVSKLPDNVGFSGALLTLGRLLAELHEAEIGLPDYTIATLATTLASDSADADALSYQLAIRLAPEYGVSLPPEFYVGADASMSRLRLRYFQPGDSDSSELPGESLSYNVTTDQ